MSIGTGLNTGKDPRFVGIPGATQSPYLRYDSDSVEYVEDVRGFGYDDEDEENDNALPTEIVVERIKDRVREGYQNMRESIPGFRTRQSQLRMIAEITKTLTGFYGDNRIIVAEAPTGTGKSISYLISAIPVVQSLNKRLIVSTGTVALQEQLVDRDLPDLKKLSGLDFTFALAKGRGRYACPANLIELTGDDQQDKDQQVSIEGIQEVGAWPFKPEDDELSVVATMQEGIKTKAWSGDIDVWDGTPPSRRLRPLLSSDSAQCIGKNCEHYEACPFFKARAELNEADVVVANHDLVMSDINLGGGAILPAPKDSIFVFDEGHHVADVALDHGASETQLHSAYETLKRTPELIHRASVSLGETMSQDTKERNARTDQVKDLGQLFDEIHDLIDASFPEPPAPKKGKPSRANPDVWRFPLGKVTDEIGNAAFSAANGVKPLAVRLNALVEKARKHLNEMTKSGKSQDEIKEFRKIYRDLRYQGQRVIRIFTTFSMMQAPNDTDTPPVSKWITRQTIGEKKATFLLSASPTSVADHLKNNLWSSAYGVVLTSATLTALGNFARVNEKLGLDATDGTQQIRLTSPFDHRRNGELCVPAMRTDPTKGQEHTDEVTEYLAKHLNPNIGTLVLFSAKKQMNEVAEALPASLRDKVLVQGQRSKNDIMEAHKKAIASGKGSIIFGVASFAEGVDLPGNLCEEVYIAKLPFSVPDSPVEATYAEWLELMGRNPFMEMSVPDACTKLIQACGRLIRKETDQGRIVLLDRRVVKKYYGKLLLNALPPFRRRIEPDAPPMRQAS